MIDILIALLIPAASFAIGALGGVRMRLNLLWNLPLTAIFLAGFVWLPGVLGDIVIAGGIVAFLAMIFVPQFSEWWYRTIVPRSWRE
jgi:hypothetical protein